MCYSESDLNKCCVLGPRNRSKSCWLRSETEYRYSTKNGVGTPEGAIDCPNQRRVDWWPTSHNFHREYYLQDWAELSLVREL